MKRIFTIILFALTTHTVIAQQKIISIGSLLNDMVNKNLDVLYPSPYYTSKLQTSHDRRSLIPGTPSWHANDDGSGFVRYEANNGRVEKVLFDEKGPGVITRIITTGGAKGTNLRFYFDGEKEASIVIPAYDISKLPVHLPPGLLLLHEHYDTTQGSSLYYPIPYGKSCKITVDDLNRTYYFHANYRTYNKDVKVRTFTVNEARSLQKKADEVSGLLTHYQPVSGQLAGSHAQLIDGGSTTFELPKGPHAIKSLAVVLEYYSRDTYAALMRGLILKINFDGKPAVSAPLGDLSGGGIGAPKVNNWYLAANGDGIVTVNFIMPYKQSAKIELINLSKILCTAIVKVNTTTWKWTKNTLYFHASWRQETGLKTNAGLDYNMATIIGRGVFKGDVLSLYNHTPRWYGEGDEHIWVDDELFPSHFGCGTEDYYNTTFAPIHVFQTPFGGAMREDDEASRGYNTFLRTRNLDAIPFKKKLKFEFELLSWDIGLVDYSSTVFWYGDLNSRAVTASADQEALRPLPKPVYTGDKN